MSEPRPFRQSLLRRALFQIHLWTGVAVGLYLLVVSLSGAALVFRIDMQRALNPQLLTPQGSAPIVGAVRILDSVRRAYPEGRILGVDAPTTARPTWLAYVSDATSFHTVLINPRGGAVLGELKQDSAIRLLQELHFNLLMGRTGEFINGIGALCLLMLCLSGAIIWWQGKGRWQRGFKVRWREGWAQINWDLHSVVGISMLCLMLIWAVSALSFIFPAAFRQGVGAISALSAIAAPQSRPAEPGQVPPDDATMIATAQQLMPGGYVARVVLPSGPLDAFQVLFAGQQPTQVGVAQLTTIYLDRHSGRPLDQPLALKRSAGDVVMEWVGPLHVGNFAGLGVKILWLILGLTPAFMFVTGAISWWRRVLRPAWSRQQKAA